MWIYIKFAPYGSLGDLVEEFKASNKLIPEVFKWLVIPNPVNACQLCESEGLIHPDIKFANISLAAPRGRRDFPAYCNPVLGDFGIMTRPDDTNSHDMGTRGWQPYEMLKGSLGTPLGKMHVQSIGIVAWALWCRSTHGTRQFDQDGNVVKDSRQLPFQSGRPFPGTTDGQEHTQSYSTKLYNLIQRCMKLKPADRPDLETLGEIAEHALGSLQASRYPGLKTAEDDKLPMHMQLDLGKEYWSIGAHVDSSKRRIPEGLS